MTSVPFVSLERQYGPFRAELHAAAIRVIDSGKYIGGPDVKAFEQEMARWMGVPEVCGVACATSGLFATLKCMGVGPGDEVITTPHTAIATAEAVSLTGAQVVFADIDPQSYGIDPREVERRITPRARVIIPVHLYGQPADMDALMDLADRRGLRVLEDCAQAQGAKHRGRQVGAMGEAGVYSFFPSKNLGGFGDGGAVVARDPALLRRIRMFSNHGRESKYLHEFEGINSRLDTLQAALLRVGLAHLDEWNAKRRQAAAWYAEELAELSQVQCPGTLPDTEPVFHVYAVQVPDRDAVQAFLKERGIGSGVHYPSALNLLPAYAHLGLGEGSYPVAESVCRRILSLPMFPGITHEEVKVVAQALCEFFQQR